VIKVFGLMDRNEGRSSYELTRDHKPGEENEKRRITSNGG
jgi:serine/threonine protein phosphatase PrpC